MDGPEGLSAPQPAGARHLNHGAVQEAPHRVSMRTCRRRRRMPRDPAHHTLFVPRGRRSVCPPVPMCARPQHRLPYSRSICPANLVDGKVIFGNTTEGTDGADEHVSSRQPASPRPLILDIPRLVHSHRRPAMPPPMRPPRPAAGFDLPPPAPPCPRAVRSSCTGCARWAMAPMSSRTRSARTPSTTTGGRSGHATGSRRRARPTLSTLLSSR
eukprot:scaffold9043_cov135-Isochrysis_galbana.AAC.3